MIAVDCETRGGRANLARNGRSTNRKLASANIRTGCARGSGSAAPISANGVVTKLTAGIASPLAAAETTEVYWNNSKVNGNKPNVTAN